MTHSAHHAALRHCLLWLGTLASGGCARTQLFLDDLAPPCSSAACASEAELTVSWQRPRLNNDGSALHDLRSHRIYYGTAPGVYPNVVDLMTDTPYPGMLEHTLTGLVAGTTYYVAVSAVDADGHESVLSSEASAVASATVAASEPAWDVVITALPFTISSAGNYRLASSVVAASGDGITVNVSGVRLYGGNGFYGDAANVVTLTYSESAPGNGVLLAAGVANVEVYGFDFVRGTATHNSIDGCSAIYGAAALGTGVRVHNNHFTAATGCAVGVGAATDLGPTRIYDNTLHITAGPGIMALVRGPSSGGLAVYRNTGSVAGGDSASAVVDGVTHADVYRNDVILEASATLARFAASWGGVGDNYFHDNVIHAAGETNQVFSPDGGASGWLLLHNRITMSYVGGGSGARALLLRNGASDIVVGYNVIEASGADSARGISFGGNEAGWSGSDPGGAWLYHNQIAAKEYALELAAPGTGLVSWANSYEGGVGGYGYAIALFGDGASGTLAASFSGDTVSGRVPPVNKPTTLSASFTVCDSFAAADVAGDTVGITFNAAPCPYPVNDVPAPPSAVALRLEP